MRSAPGWPGTRCQSEGPTITISFDSGEGLQAGQSQLKFKDIVLGTVQSLTLTPDHTHVVVTIATTRQAEPLLTDQTMFWVVKPRLFAGNVSGLETLLSGSYIGMLPAASRGKRSASSPAARIRRSSKPMSRDTPFC